MSLRSALQTLGITNPNTPAAEAPQATRAADQLRAKATRIARLPADLEAEIQRFTALVNARKYEDADEADAEVKRIKAVIGVLDAAPAEVARRMMAKANRIDAEQLRAESDEGLRHHPISVAMAEIKGAGAAVVRRPNGTFGWSPRPASSPRSFRAWRGPSRTPPPRLSF